MCKMQKLFRKGAQSLFNTGKFDKDTMHNYFMSGMSKKKVSSIMQSEWEHLVLIAFLNSDRARSDQRGIERKKYQKSLFGVRAIH